MTANETKTKVPAIYGALAKVQAAMANIPKNGRMSFGKTNYEYLKADDVQERINPLLTEHGIIVSSQYTVTDVLRGSERGVPFVYVNLTLEYISVKDGSKHVVTAVGESQAQDDKSINKALTQAIKNSHRATFQFASGEPEPDDPAPAVPSRAVTQAKAAKGAGPVTRPKAPAGGTELNKVKDHIRATYLKENPKGAPTVKKIVDEVKAEGKIADEVQIYTEAAKRLGVPYGTE